MGSLTQRVAGCVGVTLVHCCVFAVCAGRSVRPGGCGWRLQVSQRRENREKCCPDCVGRRGCGCDGCGSVGGAVRMTRSCVVFINATTHLDSLCPTRPVCVLRGLRAALAACLFACWEAPSILCTPLTLAALFGAQPLVTGSRLCILGSILGTAVAHEQARLGVRTHARAVVLSRPLQRCRGAELASARRPREQQWWPAVDEMPAVLTGAPAHYVHLVEAQAIRVGQISRCCARWLQCQLRGGADCGRCVGLGADDPGKTCPGWPDAVAVWSHAKEAPFAASSDRDWAQVLAE